MNKPSHILTSNFLALSDAYFDRNVRDSFVDVEKNVAPIALRYSIAGKHILINFYGEHVARVLSRALSHTQTKEEKLPDLTIHAWDLQSSRAPILPPWDDPHFKKDQPAHAGDFYGVYVGGEESLNFYDSKTRTGYFWTQDVALAPDWVLGAPFRTIFHWFFNTVDIHFIHGAVVGDDSGAVLLTAKSGSGKSTTALSSVVSGMNYIGDDYVAMQLFPTPMAYSLYHSAKMTRSGLQHFPEYKENIVNKDFGENEKAVVFISEIFPEQVKTSAGVRAIMIPRICGGVTRLVKASKIEAMLAIAPTTLLQLPLAETNKMAMFKSILDKIPCYYLDLGQDVRAVPEVIREYLANNIVE